jgi:hypothetical protein
MIFGYQINFIYLPTGDFERSTGDVDRSREPDFLLGLAERRALELERVRLRLYDTLRFSFERLLLFLLLRLSSSLAFRLRLRLRE